MWKLRAGLWCGFGSLALDCGVDVDECFVLEWMWMKTSARVGVENGSLVLEWVWMWKLCAEKMSVDVEASCQSRCVEMEALC